MKLLITGGAGFLGTQLARAVLARGGLCGQPLERLVLADLVEPADAALRRDPRVGLCVGDLHELIAPLIRERFDGIFHLASAVSAECEADFDLGWRANLDTTQRLLAACRAAGQRPRLVFSSSLAVFGADPALPLPAVVRDDSLPTPQSSYGVQKFICEQLVSEYTRKGFVDGRSARLMTVAVRPGRPNGAASGFLSGLVREPLAGREALCPVALDTQVALASPASTIAGLLAVFEAQPEVFGGRTALNLPALTVSVQDMLDALREIAGNGVLSLIRHAPDEPTARIVGGWPARVQSARAQRLGLRADESFHSIVLQYLRDHGDAVSPPRALATARAG